MTEKSLLIDTHAHIYGLEYTADLDQVLSRATNAGIESIIAVGADIESSRAACNLAASHDAIFCAVGIHPHDAARVNDKCYEIIREMAVGNPRVVAIGEIGLDFFRDHSPREIQEMVFRRFIRLARQLSLPVIVHDRDAHEQVVKILREEKASEVGGVLHCFSGDLHMALECVDMGFFISIPGTITFPNNESLRQVVRGIKAEYLLLETDCPYLSPVPHRGKRNEPAHVRIVAEKVAELKGLSVDDICRITTLNARRLFNMNPGDQNTEIAYKIRNSLYLNITNRCSNRCSFCAKFSDFTVKGHYLKLKHEPSPAEVLAAIGNPTGYDEIVFCGYGEPMLRLDLIKEVATELKKKRCRIRINTDGQANLVYGRNVLPELAGLVDCISVSLNAPDAETYVRLCRTPFGREGFEGVCAFLREAKRYIPKVVASAVTVPDLDIAAVKNLALSLGVEFRERTYAEVG
ncbi:MAG: magnesium-dependent deoxyribonuclease, TatD family, and radical domain iron-sulfur [Geobacteraceae bacterium]|nr:magnesium-dependent deoxyribonuclease, TatD family, and radical domain iron-sulfur [Geobacteraceae bacterium]